MRVMAFFMHENEREAARGMMPQAEVTDSFVLGEADETVIANMKANGLIETDTIAKLREQYPASEYGYEMRAREEGQSSVEVVLSQG